MLSKTVEATHKIPVPNTAEIVIFLFSAIFTFQKAYTGSKSIEKSLAILIADVAKMYDSVFLTHVPKSIESENWALGPQAKMKQKVTVT